MTNQIFRRIKICGIKGCRPINALVDTGATYSIISPELAESIGVITTRDWGTIEITACKDVLRLRKILIHTIDIEGKEIENVPAYVSDTGFEFLIGLDTLDRAGLVEQTGNLKIEY